MKFAEFKTEIESGTRISSAKAIVNAIFISAWGKALLLIAIWREILVNALMGLPVMI